MEFRKIIKFGNSSFVVSLPASWIKSNEIKKGDQIFFEVGTNNELIFKVNNSPSKIIKKKVTINSTNKSPIDLSRHIISYYIKGYNTIVILDDDMPTRSKEIKDFLQNLIGMEILEQTQKRLVAKDLTDINSISTEGIIKRMDIIIRSMMDDSIKCLKFNKKEMEQTAKSIEDRDNDVNRLAFLGYRVVRFYINYPHIPLDKDISSYKVFSSHIVIDSLEKIADTIKRRTRLYSKLCKNIECKHELIKLLEQLQTIYTNCMKAYSSEDATLAFQVAACKDSVISTHKGFLAKFNDADIALIAENLNSKLINIRNIARTIYG